MAKAKENPAGFTELAAVLELTPEVKRALGLAGIERVSSLKSLRKKMAGEGFDPAQVDAELELWNGTKEKNGLLVLLDAEKDKAEADPDQRDIEDKPDLRTWELTTEGVRELVSSIASDQKPVAAIRTLNALEDGENQRDKKSGGPRESVLRVIRAARTPLTKKVDRGGLKALN